MERHRCTVTISDSITQLMGLSASESAQMILDDFDSLLHNVRSASLYRRMKKVRDLNLIELVGGLQMVIACDSNAGIGEKPHDHLKRTYAEVARSSLKVPLVEVLASGATPVLIIDNLCVEMDPSGRTIIQEMRLLLDALEIDANIQLTGSTEDNIPTVQSGAGITVIGMGHRSCMRLGTAKPGDLLVCVGTPKDGYYHPYRDSDSDIAGLRFLVPFLKLVYLHEVVPGGSHGIRHEALEMARSIGSDVEFYHNLPIDIDSSAGSCTAVVAAIDPVDLGRLVKDSTVPICPIGVLKSKGEEE